MRAPSALRAPRFSRASSRRECSELFAKAKEQYRLKSTPTFSRRSTASSLDEAPLHETHRAGSPAGLSFYRGRPCGSGRAKEPGRTSRSISRTTPNATLARPCTPRRRRRAGSDEEDAARKPRFGKCPFARRAIPRLSPGSALTARSAWKTGHDGPMRHLLTARQRGILAPERSLSIQFRPLNSGKRRDPVRDPENEFRIRSKSASPSPTPSSATLRSGSMTRPGNGLTSWAPRPTLG